MELIHDYMTNDGLRHSLNALTQKTFGFDFEAWFTNGYFEGDYIPFSWIENGTILSNVSANRMQFMQNGIIKNYIQIGTVMTDAAYRHQGLAKKLMQHVIRQYQDCCDGIYLFGDLSALDFYRKLGFAEGVQYQYTLKSKYCRQTAAQPAFQPVDKQDALMKQRYLDAVRSSAANASLEQLNKFGLQLFYTSDLSNLYYAPSIDCFAVMELQQDTLLLHSVICKQRLPLQAVLAQIGLEYRSLILGFSPCAEDADLFDAAIYDGGDDYRLFYMGTELESIQKEKLYFPHFSHA